MKKYPKWICSLCGKKYSKKQFQISTWHKGVCDVCGETADVTEPRDFYYPDFSGKKEVSNDRYSTIKERRYR